MSVCAAKDVSKQEALVVFIDLKGSFLSKLNDPVLKDYIKEPLEKDFKGTTGQSLLLYTPSHPTTKRLLLVGLGEKSKISLQTLRRASASIVSTLRARNVEKKISVLLPTIAKFKAAEITEALETGKSVFEYEFDELRSTKNAKARQIQYATADRKDLKNASTGYERASVIAEGVNWGRRLIDMSGKQLFPEQLVKEVQKVIKSSPMKSKIKLNVWGEAELKKNKYGGILAVNQGSAVAPRLITLTYLNGKKTSKPVAMVGKGVTFDSGGLSLKPPVAQETMKYDMGGAASVLAAFKIVTDLKLKINVVCIVPSVENMPSANAQRPGDIITMANGKTVEVLNTDAEGRLILADALYHATTKFKLKAVIDAATLTGACKLAVGDAAAGIFGRNAALNKALFKAASDTSEHLWQLPDFDDFYKDLLKCDVADLRNIGTTRDAGATSAALFLKEFVHNDTPWTHIDIAGCGWYDRPRDFISKRGPSGVPIRLLAQFLESYA